MTPNGHLYNGYTLRMIGKSSMKDDSSQNGKENSNTDQAAEDNQAEEEESLRRIQDDIKSKDPTGKMNLDRRYPNRERRSNVDSDYEGPPRRYTIDRRNTTKDRRKPD